MDETAIAFEMPHARASATSAGTLPDRISVRDYTRSVEIGAFASERGVVQRVRFNVVLEVRHHTAAMDDDVDKVISYDTITEAIEIELDAERINLLETLAERVAVRCLADPRALRVFVRVEKLDRIPGALGVEIMRARLDEGATRLRPAPAAARAAALRARVVYVDPEALVGASRADWLDALASACAETVVCLGPEPAQASAATDAQRRIGLLAIDQAAWALADADPRFTVVSSRAELDWALKSGRQPVWAPTKMVMDAVAGPQSDASRPAGLALWLASEIGATEALLVGAEGVGPEGRAYGGRVARIATPSELAMGPG